MSADSPAAILFNSLGEAVGVVLDGVVYRLQVEAKISDGYSSGLALETTLAAINAKLSSLGQKLSSESVPVVLSSNHSPILVTSFTPDGYSVSNPSVGTKDGPELGFANQIGGTDGGSLRTVYVHDLNTSINNEYNLGASIRLPGSSGSVPGGTLQNPLRIDTTGTTAQPITDNNGSITVDGYVGILGTVNISDGNGSITVDNPALSVFGGGAEVTALRVTIANDSTGLVSIDDNGGSLTVDGTVTIADGGGSITVDNPALSVVGGGLEATALRITIANDSTGLVSVDDNGGSLTVDGTVSVVQSVASSLKTQVEGTEAHNVVATVNPVTVSGRASDAIPTTVLADGYVSRLWVDRRGAVKSSLVDSTGDSVMDDTNNAVRVNIVAGAAAGGGGTQYTEDLPSAGGEFLTLAGAIRQDTLANSVSAVGDYSNLKTDSIGRLWVNAGNTDGHVTVTNSDLTGTGTIAAESSFAAITPGMLNSTVAVAGTFVAINTVAYGVVGVTITGTFTSGSVVFEATGDGTNWFSVNGVVSVVGTQITSTTTPRAVRINSSGYQQVRVRAVTGFVGSVTVLFEASANSSLVTTSAPVLIAGKDSVGNPQPFRADATGVMFNALTTPGLITNLAASSPYSRLAPNYSLRVQQEPSNLLKDKYDGYVLDTNKWTTTSNSSTASITIGAGNLAIVNGTANGAWAAITSVPTFEPEGNVFMQLGSLVRFPATIPTNIHWFHGYGTAGANTIGNPLTDAIGYEVDTTGAINAVIYAAGIKIFSQTITTYTAAGSAPLNNGSSHSIDVFYNTAKVWWVIDGEDKPAVTASFTTSNVQILPIRTHIINGVGTLTSVTFRLYATAVTDTGHNNQTLSDGTYGWRKATVNEVGSLSVRPGGCSTTTLTNISGSLTSVKLASARSGRQATIIRNDTTIASNDLLISLGPIAASATSYTERVPPNGTFYVTPTDFTGELRGIWVVSAVATARITEVY